MPSGLEADVDMGAESQMLSFARLADCAVLVLPGDNQESLSTAIPNALNAVSGWLFASAVARELRIRQPQSSFAAVLASGVKQN